MFFPRYYGRFFGLMPFVKDENDPDNIPERLWEVTIFQEADTPWELADLMFAADTPLTIEWERLRMQCCGILQPYSKEPLRPADVMRFPWEEAQSSPEASSAEPELTRRELLERYRAAKAAAGLI